MLSNRLWHMRQFLAGLGLGSIALVILWGTGVAYYSSSGTYGNIGLGELGLVCSGAVFIVQVSGGLAALINPQSRFVGYGVLAMSLVSLLVAQIGCQVIFQVVHG